MSNDRPFKVTVEREQLDDIFNQLTFLSAGLETRAGFERHQIDGLARILSHLASTVYELMTADDAAEVRS